MHDRYMQINVTGTRSFPMQKRRDKEKRERERERERGRGGGDQAVTFSIISYITRNTIAGTNFYPGQWNIPELFGRLDLSRFFIELGDSTPRSIE